MYKIKILIKFQ